LVDTLSKPKAPPWSAYSSRTTTTTVKGPDSIRWTITRLVGKTFNQVQITLTPHKHQRRSSTKWKGRTTTWVTRPLIWLKSNLRWFHLLLYFTQDHWGHSSNITKVLLPMSSKTPFSPYQPINTTKRNEVLHRQRPHTRHTSDANFMMQSYPSRALDRRLKEDWARDAGEGPRVLMSLRIDFGPMG